MNPVLQSLAYVFVSCILLFLSKVLFDKILLFKSSEEIKKGNSAAIISFAGYIFGISAVLIGAFIGPSAKNFGFDLLLYASYAVAGMAFMLASGLIVDKMMFPGFDCKKEILEDRNIGMGAVYFGFYIATGLIVSACVTGDYGGILSSVIYYFAGMALMFLFLKVYDKIAPYSIHGEIEKDNYAAGIALSGNIIAIGLILMKATLADMSDIKGSIILYLIDLSAIFLLLPAARFILGNFIFRKVKINNEIEKNNVSAGIAEFVSIVCFALFIFFMIDFAAAVKGLQ